MALIALTVNDAVEYVSDRDPSKVKNNVPVDPADPKKGTKIEIEIKEGATKFFLKPLDVFLMGHIYDNASRLSGKSGSDEVGIHTRMNQTNIDAVRHGLTGFDNFVDKVGNAVKFSTKKDVVNGREYDVADDHVLQALGIQLIQELATEIKRISEVSAEEEKNSVAASPQSGS
jgi:hypothetical protein